jgi:diguanylate cyclase (GGDEF)-like protein/PAS domain S-box-containing protein
MPFDPPPESRGSALVSERAANLISLIDNTEDLIWSVDLDFRLIACNRAMQQHLDRDLGAETPLGKRPEELLQLGRTGIWHALFERALSQDPFRTEVPLSDGRTLEVALNRIVFDGRATGISIFGREITGRKRTEIKLRESGESLTPTQRIDGLGSYVLDILSGKWVCSEVLDELLGIDRESDHTFELWCSLVHPEDRAMMNDYMISEVVGKGRSFDKEYRIIRATDKVERWMHGLGSLEFDEDGQPLKLRGLIKDITERVRTDLHLRESEERYRTAFQTSIDFISLSRTGDGEYLEANEAFLDFFGYSREEVIGRTSRELGIWADWAGRQRMVEELNRTSVCRNMEAQYRKKNGELFWGLLSASTIESQGVPCVLSIVRDISDAKAAEQRMSATAQDLRVSEERYRTVFQNGLDPIVINLFDNLRYLDVNQAFLDVMGFERDEVIGRTSVDLNLWTDPRDLANLARTLRANSEYRNMESLFRKKNGDTVWGLMSSSIIEIEGSRCVLSIVRDISKAKAAEEEIRNLAFYDPLTGLPNRRLLLERLHQTRPVTVRNNHMRALLFVDLDNFKILNDTLGHQSGDLLLQETARRLAVCVRDPDTVCRLGGDEFVLLVEDLSDVPQDAAAQARVIGEKILAVVAQPYLLGSRECHISASIGVSVFGHRQEGPNEVLQQADIAMYQAKVTGRNSVRFFAPALQAAINERAALEGELRQAIRDRQFVLYYQPQMDLNRLIGAEALIRWRHPSSRILGPGEFIPLAEETGLILPIGQWVLEAACEQIASWAGRSQSGSLSIAVNISARQFCEPVFVEQVLTTIDRTGASPRNLKLELTESLMVENIEDIVAKMKELKSHGLRFALDDFGTGYSSLSYLKQLPLDQLKIDRSFIHDILSDESSVAIAQTIISLSRALGMAVMAEGVETDEQREFLTGLGCNAFQGYLFSRPLQLEDFEGQWLRVAESPVPII